MLRLVRAPQGWSRFRRTLERLLHPLYRRHAHATLRRRLRPSAMLVVCHGNMCRSPFAAALLERTLARTRVRVASAGFVGPNRPCPPDAVAVGARWGADLSTHRSTLLMADMARAADLIVVMDPAQGRAITERFGRSSGIVALGDFDPLPLVNRAIRDPVEQGADAFADSYTRIERCVMELVHVLGADAPVARPMVQACR